MSVVYGRPSDSTISYALAASIALKLAFVVSIECAVIGGTNMYLFYFSLESLSSFLKKKSFLLCSFSGAFEVYKNSKLSGLALRVCFAFGIDLNSIGTARLFLLY